VDYKQIEIIALAHLSQDKQLVEDIIDGVDVHTAVGIEYYGPLHLMSEDERRVIKTVNFGLIYGGTANALASQAGIPASEVKKIINAFYSRYPGVRVWQDKNISQVNLSRIYDGTSTTKSGYPSGLGFLHSETGRVYTFHEKDNPFKPGTVNFKPTEIKNYPVQGFATGDLVLTMVGVLWRKLKLDSVLKDTCLMVNLVHDEIVFDCKLGSESMAIKLIKETLENTPKYLKDIYNINFKLPTKVKVCIGDNWKEKKEVDL
jgi:DNA polymerase-1